MNIHILITALWGVVAVGSAAAQSHTNPSPPAPVAAMHTATTNRLTVLNKGSLGQNSASGRTKLKADVLDLKPDFVLIYIGMNDVINDRFFTPLDKYLENMTWMIAQVRQAGIKPVLCTLHHCVEAEVYKHHSPDKFTPETVNGKMDRYNAALKKLATELQVPVADFNAATARLAPADFLSDGVHLTAAGNRLLARTFLEAIVPPLRGQEKIVCYGDSLTYGYLNNGAASSDGETYPAMLRRLPLPTRPPH